MLVDNFAHPHGCSHQLRDEAGIEAHLDFVAWDGHVGGPLHRRADLRLYSFERGTVEATRGRMRVSDDRSTTLRISLLSLPMKRQKERLQQALTL